MTLETTHEKRIIRTSYDTTVREHGEAKAITAENISLSFVSEDEKGQQFLSVCEEICKRLTTTDEWKALPAYEKLYE